MKKIFGLSVALMASVAMFVGCQKSIEEADNAVANRNPTRLASEPPIGLTQNPLPGIVNEEVTITAAFDEAATICGKAKFQLYNTATLIWDDVTGFITFNGGPITYTFTPTETSTNSDNIYKFRISFAPGTGQEPGKCEGGLYNGGPSPAIDVEVVSASCNIETGDYFTYSQGWYLNPNNSNGGEFLNTNHALGPVTIGTNSCEIGTEETYTLAEIHAMGTGNDGIGILGKQIITMTLNVKASELGIIGGETNLGCLVVVADGLAETTLDDLFAGMSVNEILGEANKLYGGCTSTFSAGQLTEILGAIVDNFHLGTTNGGLLTCGSCD